MTLPSALASSSGSSSDPPDGMLRAALKGGYSYLSSQLFGGQEEAEEAPAPVEEPPSRRGVRSPSLRSTT